jgi:hypothetical protein
MYGVDLILLAQDRNQLSSLVNTAVSLCVT